MNVCRQSHTDGVWDSIQVRVFFGILLKVPNSNTEHIYTFQVKISLSFSILHDSKPSNSHKIPFFVVFVSGNDNLLHTIICVLGSIFHNYEILLNYSN